MAESDYNVADRKLEGAGGTPLTAGERVAQTVQETPDADAAAFAVTEGVSSAAYANYATALDAYQARTDIETLADRRARENGTTFAAGDFMRANAYDADGTAADAPRPGTVHGDAPASS